MKIKFETFIVLLMLALLSTACAAQETTQVAPQATASESDAATAVPTETTDSGTATGEAGTGEAAMTPTTGTEGAPTDQGTGGSALIPQTGPGDAGVPDDLDEVLRVLREAGATVEFGDAAEQDLLTVPGQVILINGEEVQIFTYGSMEEMEAQASLVATTFDSEEEPHFYKLGTMLVRYVGSDPGVRDLLEDVLGAHNAAE